MTPRPLIFDTDGGVDDAQALLMLLANGVVPTAITTVFGNVGLEAATANMLAVLATAGFEIPVHKGADRPLVQPVMDAKHVHGEDGLGGAPRPPVTAVPASTDGVGFLCRTFGEAAARGDKIDILMIGPLTNLALALRLDPTILDAVGQLTIMGGTVYGRGNTTPAAEFNIYADPEAASVVFSAPIDTVIVPWEPCTSHLATGAEVDAIFAEVANSHARSFSKGLADHARKSTAGRGGGDILRYVDPLAAAVVIDPAIVTKSLQASVGVALAPGITRGMTVVDPFGRLGTPKLTIVEAVDTARVTEFYRRSVHWTPQSRAD